MWPKVGNMSSAIVIGVRKGNLCKVLGHVVQGLVHKKKLKRKLKKNKNFEDLKRLKK